MFNNMEIVEFKALKRDNFTLIRDDGQAVRIKVPAKGRIFMKGIIEQIPVKDWNLEIPC